MLWAYKKTGFLVLDIDGDVNGLRLKFPDSGDLLVAQVHRGVKLQHEFTRSGDSVHLGERRYETEGCQVGWQWHQDGYPNEDFFSLDQGGLRLPCATAQH